MNLGSTHGIELAFYLLRNKLLLLLLLERNILRSIRGRSHLCIGRHVTYEGIGRLYSRIDSQSLIFFIRVCWTLGLLIHIYRYIVMIDVFDNVTLNLDINVLILLSLDHLLSALAQCQNKLFVLIQLLLQVLNSGVVLIWHLLVLTSILCNE